MSTDLEELLQIGSGRVDLDWPPADFDLEEQRARLEHEDPLA